MAAALLVLAVGLAACEACRSTQGPVSPTAPDAGPPTLRLYIVSNMAGALEPCGCTRDQLGGLDHAAAWIASERPRVPASVVVSGGPLFFLDPKTSEDRLEQEREKAHAIARGLKLTGFAAFAPADNDWAAGRPVLASLAQESGGAMLLANVQAGVDKEPWERWVVRDVGGVKVGLIGVGSAGSGVPGDVEQSVRLGIDAVKKEGASVLVVLASVGRGEAKRIADAAPELTLVVVGATSSGGEANTRAPLPERIGNVIIAETANHLQTMAALDLYVRKGSLTFADATGLEQGQKREELARRIDDLRIRIANWERDGNVAKPDLDARRADLATLEADRDKLDVSPPPTQGSFFRYTVKEIRESLGKEPAVSAEMAAYYKKVNEANRVAFASRVPPPAAPGQARYVGVEGCTSCHEEARKVWDATPHAHAYRTLSEQSKEYNLDCVSCHVTGYDQPGGSTVTHVERLKDVECEVCHGPGSKHIAKTLDKTLIIGKPKSDSCTACHHPPHVEQFDPVAKMPEILGPGHGKPP